MAKYGAHGGGGGKQTAPRKGTKLRLLANMLLRGVTRSELIDKGISSTGSAYAMESLTSSYGYDIRSFKFRHGGKPGRRGLVENTKYFIVGFDRPCGRYRSLTHDCSMKI